MYFGRTLLGVEAVLSAGNGSRSGNIKVKMAGRYSACAAPADLGDFDGHHVRESLDCEISAHTFMGHGCLW